MMAVVELMRKQGIAGDPSEWIPGYRAELDKVMKLRLAKLTEAEQAEAWRQHLVVKLRLPSIWRMGILWISLGLE